jgi:hypothetical protein
MDAEEELMNTVERWVSVPGTDGVYEISDLGRFRNVITGTIRKGCVLPNGYKKVYYNISGKRQNRYIHRLVAEAFCNHPSGFDIVNHIDNNKLNNMASNLEWTTQYGNIHHAGKQKRMRLNPISVIGTKNGMSYAFESIHDAARKTGCDDRCIARCCNGVYKHSKGYKWRYSAAI